MALSANFTHVYAVPGAGHIIDTIDPSTGLTSVYGRDEADVMQREPGAVRMTWEDWQAARAAQQQTPLRWEETTEHTYREMLEVLPPAAWIGGGFLVGEPDDHDVMTGAPRFRAYIERNGQYVVASRPMTIKEFRSIMQQKAG